MMPYGEVIQESPEIAGETAIADESPGVQLPAEAVPFGLPEADTPKGNPKTSDTSNPALWAPLYLIIVLFIGFLLWKEARGAKKNG